MIKINDDSWLRYSKKKAHKLKCQIFNEALEGRMFGRALKILRSHSPDRTGGHQPPWCEVQKRISSLYKSSSLGRVSSSLWNIFVLPETKQEPFKPWKFSTFTTHNCLQMASYHLRQRGSHPTSETQRLHSVFSVHGFLPNLRSIGSAVILTSIALTLHLRTPGSLAISQTHSLCPASHVPSFWPHISVQRVGLYLRLSHSSPGSQILTLHVRPIRYHCIYQIHTSMGSYPIPQIPSLQS